LILEKEFTLVWALLMALVLLLVSGAALAYVVGALGNIGFLLSGNSRYLAVLPQRIFSQIDVFSLMAMPLFILTGELMNRSGCTRALVDFSMSLVGRFKGGLGHVNIMANIFFAGISGSAVADAAALGTTLIPAMREQGYTNRYAGAVTAAASIIGPIIPPSIIMIFYGAIMQTSVGGLFMGGIVPGLLLGGGLMAGNAYFAHRHNHPGGKGEQMPKLVPSLLRAAPALMLPLIILGGMVFGVVTPTEAGALAAILAASLGFVYEGMDFHKLRESFRETAILSGSIFMVITAAACAGWLASLEQIPEGVGLLVNELGLTGMRYLLLVNLIFLAAGMVMDVPMALALLVPIFAPTAIAQGVDPIHLGVILCLNLTIGLVTPPIGACLMVISAIARENYWALARETLPFVFIEIVVLIAITFFPDLVLFVPRLMGLS
jgi:tripartite ATP-independent transporter DctM subunit